MMRCGLGEQEQLERDGGEEGRQCVKAQLEVTCPQTGQTQGSHAGMMMAVVRVIAVVAATTHASEHHRGVSSDQE